MLKRIARKILRTEIEVYEKTIRDMWLDKISLENSKNREILRLTEEAKKALEEKCRVEKENKILRRYYDLDKEPSDEIKAKIHVDLEINRLKEDNLKLIAMYNKPAMVIPQPYLHYGFGYRPF